MNVSVTSPSTPIAAMRSSLATVVGGRAVLQEGSCEIPLAPAAVWSTGDVLASPLTPSADMARAVTEGWVTVMIVPAATF